MTRARLLLPASLLIAAAFCLGLPSLSGQTTEQSAAPAVALSADKTPAVIYLFRHAEKPDGDKKDPNLTPVGFHRADLLPTLFVPQPNPAQPGTVTAPRLRHPDVIFATAMSKHSNRPVETITPLARALREPINTQYEDHDFAALAAEVLSGKYAGKVVVICWHHGEIPHLAAALGATTAPAKWDDNTFNQIWKIDYAGGTAHLTPISEALLPGDPSAPAAN